MKLHSLHIDTPYIYALIITKRVLALYGCIWLVYIDSIHGWLSDL